jgi:hypothetical protein
MNKIQMSHEYKAFMIGNEKRKAAGIEAQHYNEIWKKFKSPTTTRDAL